MSPIRPASRRQSVQVDRKSLRNVRPASVAIPATTNPRNGVQGLAYGDFLVQLQEFISSYGGGGGIRTHGGLAPTAVFKTAALNHSATPPEGPRQARTCANL